MSDMQPGAGPRRRVVVGVDGTPNMSVRHIFPYGLRGPADRIVARGKAAETLVRLSAGAELLVIGARIHSEYGNLLGGDVVPYCLSRASCPVDICADQRSRAPQPAAAAHSAAARSAAAARALREARE